jgi:DNA-binding transcriptional regulator GbsR (MarR family)
MPFYVGKKKARRKAKQLIEHIREAFERLEQQAEQGIDEDVLIIRADVIKTDIVRAAQTVDQYPELLQQLNTIRAQLQAYIDEINDDDDELLLLLW